MDDLARQMTLSKAYDVVCYKKTCTTAQLFWALDRFHYDMREIDESSREQRIEAAQECAVELDKRNVPLRNPEIPVEFPRDYPE